MTPSTMSWGERERERHRHTADEEQSSLDATRVEPLPQLDEQRTNLLGIQQCAVIRVCVNTGLVFPASSAASGRRTVRVLGVFAPRS